MADGSVNIDTKVDSSGLKSGLKDLSSVASSAISGLTKVLAGTTAAISALAVASVKSYADYEQLVGGVETLFGAGGQSLEEYAESVGQTVDEAREQYDKLIAAQESVQKASVRAYETAGLSMNEYMETVTSFAASLKQSCETELEAAEKADQAVIDMADNANKMGTSMESIQNAYQGFAKQNYTMLDNLKLGYGGTKEEMERLLADAEKLTGIKYDISSLSDVYEAIHVIQTELGITGTTAKEAATTISGSIGMMKSAWTNLVTAMASDELPLDEFIDAFVDSVGIVADNVLPRVEIVLGGIADLISTLAPKIASKVPELVGAVLPSLLEGATSLVSELAAALPSLLDTVVTSISDNTGILVDSVISIGGSIVDGLLSIAPALAELAADIVYQLASGIVDNIPTIIQTAGDMLEGFASAFETYFPVVVSKGAELLTQLVNGIAGNLPSLVSAALDALMRFATTLYDNAPTIIETGFNLLSSLAQGIIDALPELIAKGPEIISKFANVINDNFPTILAKGAELLWQIITGIISVIPDLISNAGNIIKAIVDVFTAFEWLNLGKSIISWFKDGIVNMISAVSNAATNVRSSVVEVISNLPGKLFEFGKNAIEFLGNGIKGMASAAITAAKNVISGIISSLASFPSKFVTIGKNLLLGIADGIAAAVSSVISKAISAVSGIVDSVKKFFGIASPSKLFKNLIGKNLMLGLAEGIAAEGQAAIDAAVDVAEDIADVDFNTQTPDVPDPDNVDYAAIASNVRSSVQSAKTDTGTAVSAGSASEYYRGGADDSDTADDDSTGENPKYIQNDIHLDGKRVARVITPYVAEELEWEGK